jgi:NADPH-dependent 7-cyano-7-deazaguanine reductase QueF-like protein
MNVTLGKIKSPDTSRKFPQQPFESESHNEYLRTFPNNFLIHVNAYKEMSKDISQDMSHCKYDDMKQESHTLMQTFII